MARELATILDIHKNNKCIGATIYSPFGQTTNEKWAIQAAQEEKIAEFERRYDVVLAYEKFETTDNGQTQKITYKAYQADEFLAIIKGVCNLSPQQIKEWATRND